jgi:hypothetical protein
LLSDDSVSAALFQDFVRAAAERVA